MTALEKGDWRSVEDAHGNSEDWATRGSVAAALRRLDPIDDWVLSCPRSGLAHAVRGSQLCRLAWDVRGNGKANTVDRNARGDFFSLLRAAEESFGKAVELESRDPYPWSQLIWTGTGPQIPKDDVLGRFESMRERDGGFVPGWLAITSAVAQKWSGSHTLMFDVARYGDRTLPDGNLGRVGLIRAHEEFRMYLAHWDNDPIAAKAHFRAPEVAAEIGAAASASVFSAHHEPGGSTPLAQSWLLTLSPWSATVFALSVFVPQDCFSSSNVSAFPTSLGQIGTDERVASSSLVSEGSAAPPLAFQTSRRTIVAPELSEQRPRNRRRSTQPRSAEDWSGVRGFSSSGGRYSGWRAGGSAGNGRKPQDLRCQDRGAMGKEITFLPSRSNNPSTTPTDPGHHDAHRTSGMDHRRRSRAMTPTVCRSPENGRTLIWGRCMICAVGVIHPTRPGSLAQNLCR